MLMYDAESDEVIALDGREEAVNMKINNKYIIYLIFRIFILWLFYFYFDYPVQKKIIIEKKSPNAFMKTFSATRVELVKTAPKSANVCHRLRGLSGRGERVGIVRAFLVFRLHVKK